MKIITKNMKDMEVRIAESTKRKNDSTRLPYMCGTVGELLEPYEEAEAAGSGMKEGRESIRVGGVDIKLVKNKAVVVKTTTRQSFYLPTSGLVDHETLRPGDLIATNKDTYNIYEKLPPEYD